MNNNNNNNINSTAGTPLSFSFFLFFLVFFVVRFSSPFCRSPCSPSLFLFSFVLSFRILVFRLFLVSPSSTFFSLPCFPWWRILLFCYFVSALRRTPSPALLASLKYACSPCVLSSFLRSWCWFIYFFLLFLFRFRFGHRLCHPVFFLVGTYAVSSVLVSAATRLANDKYLDTYVRWSHLFVFVWGTRFVSFIVCITFRFFIFFSSWGNLPLQSYWSQCPVTTDCIVAMTQ